MTAAVPILDTADISIRHLERQERTPASLHYLAQVNELFLSDSE